MASDDGRECYQPAWGKSKNRGPRAKRKGARRLPLVSGSGRAAQSPEAAQDEHEDLDPAWLHDGASDFFDPDFSFFRA